MDIVRGSLDDISRPASSSRMRSGSRASSACSFDRPRASMTPGGSLVLLTPEPQVSQEQCDVLDIVSFSSDSPADSCEDVECDLESHSKQHKKITEAEECKVDGTREICCSSNEKINSILQKLQSTSANSENIASPVDSEEDCADVQQHDTNEAKKQMTGAGESDEENKDPQLQDAIQKMRKLDRILAKKQAKERMVKKQGQELREKLWDELQAARPEGSSENLEEAANTRQFLALASSHISSCDVNKASEDVVFIPVFHTQVPTKENERGDEQPEQGFISDLKDREKGITSSNSKPDEDSSSQCSSSSSSKQRDVRRKQKKQDFIKRNVQLAKNAGHAVLLTDDEKRRLAELLKDIEDDRSSELPGSEEDSALWDLPLAAGEGYTPEPSERQQLEDIDNKLKAVLSTEDFLAVCSPYSSSSRHIYQVTTMEGSLESLDDNLLSYSFSSFSSLP